MRVLLKKATSVGDGGEEERAGRHQAGVRKGWRGREQQDRGEGGAAEWRRLVRLGAWRGCGVVRALGTTGEGCKHSENGAFLKSFWIL